MFSSVCILDFSSNAAGPYGTTLFASYGARVIKVERPKSGDDGRAFGPFVDDVSLAFEALNGGKDSIAIDLKDPESIELIYRLLPQVDVVIESFRPGIMDKLGLGYQALKAIKPDLIYASISAFGQKGEYSNRPGYDIVAQAVSGIMSTTGDPEDSAGLVGFALGDMVGALNLYACVASALYHHKNTGEGQYIDISLAQGLIWMNGSLNTYNTGKKPKRTGNHNANLSPYGLHEGKDGQSIVIAAVNKKTWESLCDTMGKSELKNDPRFDTLVKRVENRPALTAIIETWLQDFDDIGDAADSLLKAGVPSTKVYSCYQVCDDPVFRELGWIQEKEIPDRKGKENFVFRGLNATFSKTPGELKPAPDLGQHTRSVMESVGYGSEEIDSLLEKWN